MQIPKIVILPSIVAICALVLGAWIFSLRYKNETESPHSPQTHRVLRSDDDDDDECAGDKRRPDVFFCPVARSSKLYDQLTGRRLSRTTGVQPSVPLPPSPSPRCPESRTHGIDTDKNRDVAAAAVLDESAARDPVPRRPVFTPTAPRTVAPGRTVTEKLASPAPRRSIATGDAVPGGNDGLGVGVGGDGGDGTDRETRPLRPSRAGVAVDSAWLLRQQDEIVEHSKLVTPSPGVRSALLCSQVSAPLLGYVKRLRRFSFMSEARDPVKYPSPAYYRSTLPIPQKNVVAIGLNLAVIPLSEYNINEYNAWLDIDVAGVTYSVLLPVGTYNGTTIAPGLQAAIVATNVALAAYTVTLTPLTSKITIDTNGPPCVLLFRTGPHVNRNLWQVLGFPRFADTLDLAVHVAPGTVSLFGAMSIDVFIDEISNSIQSTDNAFARIDLLRTVVTADVTFFTPPGDGLPLAFWPISRLTFLTFSMLVKYTEITATGDLVERYRPYLFNGRDHILRLDIITQEYKSPLEESIELEPVG